MSTDLEQLLSRRLHELTPEPPAHLRYHAPDTTRPEGASPLDLVPLDIIPVRQRARARRWWAPAAVAASIAAIAATVAIWPTGTSSEDAGSPPVPNDPVRTLPFTLPASSGLALIEAGTGIKGGSDHPGVAEDAVLSYRGRTAASLLLSSDTLEHTRSEQVPAQLRQVQIDGHPGYAGQVSGTAKVFWAYSDGRVAELLGDGPTTTDTLLTIAGAMDFTDRTLMRTPLRVTAAPAGMTLSAVDSYLSGDIWNAFFSYADNAGVVSVYAYPGDHDPSSQSIRGKYCETRDSGGTVHVCAFGSSGVGQPDLKAIVATVRIAANPTDRHTWFDPTTALP